MRRLRHDLLYTYNIVFNLVSEAANDHFSSFSSFKCFINSVDLTSHLTLGLEISCEVICGAISVFNTFSDRWNFTDMTYALPFLLDFM